MKVEDQRVKSLYDYLDRITQIAYQDEYLTTMAVLSRGPFCENFLKQFKPNHPLIKTTQFYIFKNVLFYYIKNTTRYFIQLFKLVAHFFSGQNYNIDASTKNLVLIDVSIFPKYILINKNFICKHFPDLEETIKKQGKAYALTSKFFESNNLFQLYKSFKILKEKKRPVLTEFQILEFSDYILAFKFLLVYPFHVMRFIKQLGSEPEDKFLIHTIFGTLDDPSLLYYFQILYGRRISLLPAKKIKCISWYENQPRDKCFYRGLRMIKGKVVVYGAQLFIYPSNLGTINPEIGEIKFGVVPDKIIVNGSLFLPEKSPIEYRIGPSLRYKKIFQIRANPTQSENILVLLSYFEPENRHVLNLINKADLKQPILIKFHPYFNQKKLKVRVGQGVQVVQDNHLDLIARSKIVIGMATGTLAEAASLGIPAININIEGEFSEFSPGFMPEFGKGIIWDNASNTSEVVGLVNFFNTLMDTKPEKIEEMGKKYKEIFFSQPLEQKIIEAFDLK
jgi:hypothetical protein